MGLSMALLPDTNQPWTLQRVNGSGLAVNFYLRSGEQTYDISVHYGMYDDTSEIHRVKEMADLWEILGDIRAAIIDHATPGLRNLVVREIIDRQASPGIHDVNVTTG